MADEQPAAKARGATHRLCAAPPPSPIPLPEGLAPARLRAIRVVKKKWVNGTILHYHFLDGPGWNWPEAQKDAVRWAFGVWKGLGIGLEFIETPDPSEAELRIGFDQSDGSWSFVGTDGLKYEDRGRTMNFGWDLTGAWGRATALHEIGHALGMPHEHQNPMAGIKWNEARVYEHFSRPPNSWDAETIRRNILRKLDPTEVEGSGWDPESIMHYPFEAGLILAPAPYDQGTPDNTELSAHDGQWAIRFYPPQQNAASIGVMDLRPLAAASGDQRDFLFEPPATRDYTIRIVGKSDCKIVVFVERDGEPRHHEAEDDSGTPDNAIITTKLVKGQRYLIRVRTHYAEAKSGLALLIL